MNGFNLLAPVYDKLAKLFFGSAISKAQVYFLDQAATSQHALIVGGGTGELASALLARWRELKITYVDTSEEMIELAAKKCNPFRDRIQFIHGSIDQLDQKRFDIILTPFFLDMFSDETTQQIIVVLQQRLHQKGKWIATDFTKSHHLRHRILRWTMYRFFRILCGIEASDLPDWETALRKNLRLTESREFYSGFIKSAVYVNEL